MMEDKIKENLEGLPTKMVQWENPPLVRDLRADLLAAKPDHDLAVTRIDNYLKEFDLEYNENRAKNANKKRKLNLNLSHVLSENKQNGVIQH